jgi:hypothetical protein
MDPIMLNRLAQVRQQEILAQYTQDQESHDHHSLFIRVVAPAWKRIRNLGWTKTLEDCKPVIPAKPEQQTSC